MKKIRPVQTWSLTSSVEMNGLFLSLCTTSWGASVPKFHCVPYIYRGHSAGTRHAFVLAPLPEPKSTWNITASLVHSYPGPPHVCLCCWSLLAQRPGKRAKGREVSLLASFNSAEPFLASHGRKPESSWTVLSQPSSTGTLVSGDFFPSTHFSIAVSVHLIAGFIVTWISIRMFVCFQEGYCSIPLSLVEISKSSVPLEYFFST